MSTEFQEIAHSGGQVTLNFRTEEGRRLVSHGFRHCRPNAWAGVQYYVLMPGIVVEVAPIYGIGVPTPPPSIPGCFPVMIMSDSQGKFGHNCPACRGYWRSDAIPLICPYCAHEDSSQNFLSDAQRRYVHHYARLFDEGVHQDGDTEYVIDMDAVADASGKEGEKPAFYVSDVSQQHQFTCTACDQFNDVLGHFAFCSSCGTRNDRDVFENETVMGIRERLNKGGDPSTAVKEAVSAFDTVAGQYAKQLLRLVPLSERRRNVLKTMRFHNFVRVVEVFREWFDIELVEGIKESEQAFVKLRFHRRHVYEHNGGEVDQKYLDDSGDTSVVLKQVIRETREDAHSLIGSLIKVVRNLHKGFHDLLPPAPEPIKYFEERKARMEEHRSQQRG
jgi:Zn finger protein HypA/HybF involved in hydrogenase expression